MSAGVVGVLCLVVGMLVGAGWTAFLLERDRREDAEERAYNLQELELGVGRKRPDVGQFVPTPDPEQRIQERAEEARQQVLQRMDRKLEKEGVEPAVRRRALAEIEEKVEKEGIL